jgi:rare lipoprotein A
MKHAHGFRQKGIASWYGKKFHGRKTSNGEIYNMYAMTGAHKTLPLGTYVRVHNLRNGQEVVVRINDRGPFVDGRIVDLSYSAAKKIGLVGPGTAPVTLVALGVPQETISSGKPQRVFVPGNYYVGDFVVQVGAFKEKANAVALKDRLAEKYDGAHIAVFDGIKGRFYRVRVARCRTLDEARRYEALLEKDGFPDAIVVAR